MIGDAGTKNVRVTRPNAEDVSKLNWKQSRVPDGHSDAIMAEHWVTSWLIVEAVMLLLW